MGFRKSETSLKDVLLVEPDIYSDDRGSFAELYNRQSYENIGLAGLDFVQDNLSISFQGVIRGMHFQKPPHAQGKLVCVLQGAVLDIALDLRKDSPTYGQFETWELTAENWNQLYIPPGFAHGFQVLSDHALFLYKCTAHYNKSSEGGIIWDDPDLALPWHNIPPVVSEKDKLLSVWNNFESPF